MIIKELLSLFALTLMLGLVNSAIKGVLLGFSMSEVNATHYSAYLTGAMFSYVWLIHLDKIK